MNTGCLRRDPYDMGRESIIKQVLLLIRFFFEYIYCILFRDLPRLLTLKRKNISEQVVVVTGGAMGIGKGLAKKLSINEHAIVCILDINEKEGLQTINEINNEGGRAYFFRCNVADPNDIRFCANQIYSEPNLGSVDIVICNAAVLRVGGVLDMADDDFKITNDVNFLGYIYTARAFLPKMIEKNKGHIVAIGSICSYFGENLGTAYCSAKFAVRGFMESLEMEFSENGYDGIALTTIFPYFVNTTLVTNNLTEPFSTFFDVVPLDYCVEEMTDAILKERLTYFVPWIIGFLCSYAKGLKTKCITPFSRRFFNFRYSLKVPTTEESDAILPITL